MSRKSMSVLSTDWVRARLSATENGVPVDPSDVPVEFAFPRDSTGILEEDWYPGEWENAQTARILVGPSDGVELEPGTYRVWVRFDTGVEYPHLKVGILEMFFMEP